MAGISEHFEMLTGKVDRVIGPLSITCTEQRRSMDSGTVFGESQGLQRSTPQKRTSGRGSQQPEGAAPLATNDDAFAANPTFKTGATDYLDETDPPSRWMPTTDTSLMSASMVSRMLVDSGTHRDIAGYRLRDGEEPSDRHLSDNAPPRNISVTAVDASALTLEAVIWTAPWFTTNDQAPAGTQRSDGDHVLSQRRH